MKKLVGVLAIAMLASCGSAEKKSDRASADSAIAIVENTAQPVEPVKPVDTTSIFGAYVGSFVAEEYGESGDISYTNRITLFVDSMRGDSIFGHSVVAGNQTPFQGLYTSLPKGEYQVEASEPGTGKYDGKFSFIIDSSSQKANGMWTANDRSLQVTKRSFELQKQRFRYDPKLALPEHLTSKPITEIQGYDGDQVMEAISKDALRINASTTLLKKEDVENMKRGDLEVMRNAIYARHGYTFRNRRMRYLFQYVDWYMPVSADIRANLTEIEKQNIALLKRYEEHAEKYYDYFGR